MGSYKEERENICNQFIESKAITLFVLLDLGILVFLKILKWLSRKFYGNIRPIILSPSFLRQRLNDGNFIKQNNSTIPDVLMPLFE